MIQSLIKNTQNKGHDECPSCQSPFITTFDVSDKESKEHKCINCKYIWETPKERIKTC